MSTYQTIDYLPDLTFTQMSDAQFLTFEPYEGSNWDNEAKYSTNEAHAGLYDTFSWSAQEGATYDIFSHSYYDPYAITVYDNQGNAIATDDPPRPSDFDGMDSVSNFVAPYTGTYYVNAGWSQYPSTDWLALTMFGNCAIFIDEDIDTIPASLVDDYSDAATTTAFVNVGGQVTGDIEQVGDADWFRISVEAGRTYQIDLEGESTAQGTLSDPYLGGIYSVNSKNGIITGATLKMGTSSNDDGYGLNSKVIFTPEITGSFIISATSANFSTGSYTLSVTEILNNSPELSLLIPDQIAVLDQPFNYKIPDNTFFDPDGDTLSFNLEVNATIDTFFWLSFDSTTQTLHGIPTDSDQGILSLRVTATDESGATVTDYFDLTVLSNHQPTGNVVIFGETTVGEILAVDVATLDDVDGLGSLSYQWLRGDVTIPGATDATFSVTSSDVGSSICVEVSYVDGIGTMETLTSEPTSSVDAAEIIGIESHMLSVIVDQGVLETDPVLLKNLNESMAIVNGIISEHTVEYNGTIFNYSDIDSLIMIATRDDEFTAEFREEIFDLAPSFANISYQDAVTLIGVANIDATLISVAGEDGMYVA